MEKNYSANVGISGFSYALLTEDTAEGATYDEVVDVPFAQEIGIETEMAIEKAYGDNKVAEMATSTGTTTLTMQFHALPLEVRQELLGLKEEDGITVQHSQVQPPKVAVSLYLDKADGSQEIVGLTKGIFTLPATEGSTKEDSIEFGSDSIEGEFMSRTFDDVTKIMAAIPADDETGIKDKFFNKLLNTAIEG